MMKRLVVFFLESWIFSFMVIAQSNIEPYSIVDDRVIISKFQTIEKLESEAIFINALLWTIQNAPQPEEKVLEVDYDKKQLQVSLVIDNPKTACRYRYTLSTRVADNIITILASEISQEAETSVIKLVKRLPFEKLNPEKKPKHKDYLTDFADLHEKCTAQLLDFVATNQFPSITHWREIKEKNIIKGMNPTECILSLGKPASIQKQGNKEEWMYDAYTYVFFEDGKVSSVIK